MNARCSICQEPAGHPVGNHTIGNCPAAQDHDATRAELIRSRKLLRKLAEYFGESCIDPLASEVRERLKWPGAPSF